MAALTQFLQALLGVAFPIAAFYAVKRRPAHTRAQLVVGAALGGGLGGAIIAGLYLRTDKTEVARAERLYTLAADGRIKSVTGFFGEPPVVKQ